MKSAAPLLILAASTQASDVTPVGKVVSLLSDLQAKILSEGKEAQKTYSEFAEWCEERSKDLGFEIKTGKAEAEDLSATIAKETATSGSLNAKMDELSAALATDEADLKAATEIRHKEQGEFAAAEQELTEVVSMLERAISILEREMAKGGASMLQLKNAQSVAQALSVMVQASVLSSADASRLTALVQSSQSSSSDDEDAGAPDAAVYQGHSGDIIETLQSILDKAGAQLSEARKTETSNVQNFQMLQQSLEDEIKFGNKDMDAAKKALATSAGSKAKAEGGLAVTNKDLAADSAALTDLHQECLSKSQDYEAEVKSRDEELKALAQAKKVITEETGGADGIQYGLNQVSLIQISSGADLAKLEAVRFVFDLAQKQGSAALAQLANRMSTAMKTAGGDDPFAKVKGLITDMIARLESEADADASHKAYCDKELSEANEKKDDKTSEIEKLTTSIDQMSARSAQLKQEVARLQKELADLASSQAEMGKLRAEENANYKTGRADMEQGLAGVKLALKVLREYYSNSDKAHEQAQGAGEGIIGLLEVIESDFTKTFAEIVSTEESAVRAYDKQTKENAIQKAAKDQDVKYKAKESADLDKSVTEANADRSGVQTELDAINEYLDSLHKQCDEKVEPYAERKRRREAEVAGLKEALTILEGQASLIQKGTRSFLSSIHRH